MLAFISIRSLTSSTSTKGIQSWF